MKQQTRTLHDEVLDAADALMDIAEREMAEAWAAGRVQAACRWLALAQHLAAGIRAVRPEIHREARGDLPPA